jgi:hypothetical protein
MLEARSRVSFAPKDLDRYGAVRSRASTRRAERAYVDRFARAPLTDGFALPLPRGL